MNDPRIREQIRRIIDLADSIADEYQHHLNIQSSTGVPAAGVGQLCRVVRIVETAERTARDFHAILDHPAGVGAARDWHAILGHPAGVGAAPLAGVVADVGRLEPDHGDPPRVAAGDG